MITHRHARLVLALTLLAAAFASGAVHAERGVGVSTGEMTVGTLLAPGGGYALPAITVINTGDEPSLYRVSIGYLDGQSQRRPGAGWFTVRPETFSLRPGESMDVVVSIDVPAGAAAGDYFALVKAQTASEADGRTSLGVAAATKLVFTVDSSGWLQSWWRELLRLPDRTAPWGYAGAAALLLAFLAPKARRLPYRLRLERK